jgi:hypothetical protein
VVVPEAVVAVGTLIGVTLAGTATATGVVAVDVVASGVRVVGSAAELSVVTSSSAGFGDWSFAPADFVSEEGCVALPPAGPSSSELALEGGGPPFTPVGGSLFGGGLEALFAALASAGGCVSSERRGEGDGCGGGAVSDAVLLPTRASKRSLAGC